MPFPRGRSPPLPLFLLLEVTLLVRPEARDGGRGRLLPFVPRIPHTAFPQLRARRGLPDGGVQREVIIRRRRDEGHPQP